MSGQSVSWYVRGEDNQPSGPFTAEVLIQRVKAGELDRGTVCWREGMSEWLPFNRVEPFASAVVSAKDRRPSQKSDKPATQKSGAAPPLPVSRWRSLGTPAKIALIGGGITVLGAVIVAGVLLLINRKGADQATEWGTPVRVMDEENGTTFLVELKDAWWLQGPPGEKAENDVFFLRYTYRNVGPRQGAFSISKMLATEALKNSAVGKKLEGEPKLRLEVKTDTGILYPGFDFGVLWREKGPKHDLGEWRPVVTAKIDETGESALIFPIPKGETPTELITPPSLGLSRTLPSGPFGSRYYSEVFGFLPEAPEKIVPGLIVAFQEKDARVRNAAMREMRVRHLWAAEHVPVLIEAARDSSVPNPVCVEAITILGELGPAAKQALPALILIEAPGTRDYDPFVGNPATMLLRGERLKAAKAAREKIGDIDAVVSALVEIFEAAGNDVQHRIEAAKALGVLGEDARQAVPALKKAHDAPQIHIRTAAKDAFEKIDPRDFSSFETERKMHEQSKRDEQLREREHKRKEEQDNKRQEENEKPREEGRERKQTQKREREEFRRRTSGPLAGGWEHKDARTRYRIEDDEKTLTISLMQGNSQLRTFSGQLTRAEGEADSFEGTVQASFPGDRPDYSERITASLNKSGQLVLLLAKWPDFDSTIRSKTKTLKATLTRIGAGTARKTLPPSRDRRRKK